MPAITDNDNYIMEEKLREILNRLYEAEGLIEMALRRPADQRGNIVSLAIGKCFDVAESASLFEEAVDDVVSLSGEETDSDEPDPAERLFMSEVMPSLESRPQVDNEVVTGHKPDVHEETEASVFDVGLEDDNTETAVVEGPASEDKEVVIAESGVVRRPLARFLTINDKFRFRRELFSNSDMAFKDALSLIETMDTMEEVTDYFFNDLQWDPESAEVKEFAMLVERYMRESAE